MCFPALSPQTLQISGSGSNISISWLSLLEKERFLHSTQKIITYYSYVCLSGQNSAHIPEEFSVHLLFGLENFKNPQNLSALFCYKVDILKLQGRDWSAIQLRVKYPLHKQSENP